MYTSYTHGRYTRENEKVETDLEFRIKYHFNEESEVGHRPLRGK